LRRRITADLEIKGKIMASLPKINTAYPVLISVGNGSSGSGFYLDNDSAVYLVTACHVLFKDRLELYPGITRLTSLADDFATKFTYELDCAQLWADGALKKHPRADVAVCRIATLTSGPDGRNMYSVPGVTAKSRLAVGTHVIGMPATSTRAFDEVEVSNDVFLFGYPTSLGHNAQIDRATPLLRKGIIAGKAQDGRLIINCPVYFGNSGGLVMEVEYADAATTYYHGIGIAVQMVPFVEELWSKQFNAQTGVRYENSGYSIVEPMDRILELL
jgi:hypothetical protein